MPASSAQAADDGDSLPEGLRRLIEGFSRGEPTVPEAGFFDDPEVLAAERARLFTRFWVIADHASRLDQDGCFFTLDSGAVSLIVTREAPDHLHALRNLCLHAGYPVCAEAEGQGDRLHCPYHDWLYALDGRLLYPAISPERHDPARLRLLAYPLILRCGLILIDPGGQAAPPEPASAALPGWLAEAAIGGRSFSTIARNWKELNCGLRAIAPTLLGGAGTVISDGFGPLNLVVADAERALLIRLIPKAPQCTGLAVVRLAAAREAPDWPDRLAERLTALPGRRLDRGFLTEYVALLAAGA